MKINKKYILGAAVIAFIALLPSCEKTFDDKTPGNTDFSNSALTQLFVATVNANRNFVWVDANRINGSSLTSGSLFPSSGAGFEVKSGIKDFLVRDTLSTTTQVPYSFGSNLQSGKRYTVFLYDTITSPKQKTVETNIVIPSDTTCRLRFANFIYNPFAIPNVDVYSYKKASNIFSNMAVSDVSSFVSYPSRLTDTLDIKETGTSNLLLKVIISGGLTDKRSYTLVYRGSHRGTRTSNIFNTY